MSVRPKIATRRKKRAKKAFAKLFVSSHSTYACGTKYGKIIIVTGDRDHLFSAYAKFSEKLTFLTP